MNIKKDKAYYYSSKEEFCPYCDIYVSTLNRLDGSEMGLCSICGRKILFENQTMLNVFLIRLKKWFKDVIRPRKR